MAKFPVFPTHKGFPGKYSVTPGKRLQKGLAENTLHYPVPKAGWSWTQGLCWDASSLLGPRKVGLGHLPGLPAAS